MKSAGNFESSCKDRISRDFLVSALGCFDTCQGRLLVHHGSPATSKDLSPGGSIANCAVFVFLLTARRLVVPSFRAILRQEAPRHKHASFHAHLVAKTRQELERIVQQPPARSNSRRKPSPACHPTTQRIPTEFEFILPIDLYCREHCLQRSPRDGQQNDVPQNAREPKERPCFSQDASKGRTFPAALPMVLRRLC